MEYVKKFNQWADYKGKFKGKLLTPMEFAQFGVKGRDLYITLNDYFSVKEQSHKQTCTTSGNRLTDWELRRVKIHLKDYINWIKNKDEIMEQWEEDAELFQIEREELEDYYESYSYGEYEDELPF